MRQHLLSNSQCSLPCFKEAEPSGEQRLTLFLQISPLSHDTSRSRRCTSDAPREKPGELEKAHKGREALNDGCSWVSRSHTFALLSLMGRMTIVEEISAVSLETSTHTALCTGDTIYSAKYYKAFYRHGFNSVFLFISILVMNAELSECLMLER